MSDRAPYPASMMAEARQLYSVGWPPSQIQAVWRRRGHERIPTETTIRMWIDERYRERQLAAHRRQSARSSTRKTRFRLPSNSPEYQAAFICLLREDGMPWQSVVRTCNVVFEGVWTVERAQRMAQTEEVAA